MKKKEHWRKRNITGEFYFMHSFNDIYIFLVVVGLASSTPLSELIPASCYW